MIVPIPMFWRRRLGRGKNSPEMLAGCLAKSLGVPVRRRRLGAASEHVAPGGLGPSRRFENMQGAFRVRRPDAVKAPASCWSTTC